MHIKTLSLTLVCKLNKCMNMTRRYTNAKFQLIEKCWSHDNNTRDLKFAKNIHISPDLNLFNASYAKNMHIRKICKSFTYLKSNLKSIVILHYTHQSQRKQSFRNIINCKHYQITNPSSFFLIHMQIPEILFIISLIL